MRFARTARPPSPVGHEVEQCTCLASLRSLDVRGTGGTGKRNTSQGSALHPLGARPPDPEKCGHFRAVPSELERCSNSGRLRNARVCRKTPKWCGKADGAHVGWDPSARGTLNRYRAMLDLKSSERRGLRSKTPPLPLGGPSGLREDGRCQRAQPRMFSYGCTRPLLPAWTS